MPAALGFQVQLLLASVRCPGVPVSKLLWAIVAGIACVSGFSPAVRQTIAQEDQSAVADESHEEAFPDIFQGGSLQTSTRLWVRGADGTPVPTNTTLEQLRTLEERFSEVSQFPAATLESVQVEATVADDRSQLADVSADFAVRLAEEQTPVRVDLNLRTMQLSQRPAVVDEEELRSRFRVSPDGSGYQWLLMGEPDSVHRIQLHGKTALVGSSSSSNRKSLALDLPESPSTIRVRLPASVTDLRVDGDHLLHNERSPEGVVATISSRGGRVELSWQRRTGGERVAAVDATSRTTFNVIDPRQAWTATTNLWIRWSGPDAHSTFRVLLPPRAVWRTFPNVEFDRFRVSLESVEPDDGTADRDSPAGAEQSNAPQDGSALDTPGNSGLQPPLPSTEIAAPQLVIENLDPARSDSIHLVVEWEWIPPHADDRQAVAQARIPVPSVREVDSHRGYLDVIFPTSYSAVFESGPSVGLTQQGRADGMHRGRQMQFGFTQQNFELVLTLREEQSLPTVRPTYLVKVDPNKLTLTAWFECLFDTGQNNMELGLFPGDWIVEENTARVLSDPNDPFVTENDVLDVRSQQDGSFVLSSREREERSGSNRRVEQVWRVVAERSWTPDDDNQLQFQVPDIFRGRNNGVAEVDHGSGVLLVDSDRSVLTQWNETSSTGLLPDSFSTEYRKYVPQTGVRDPLAYRFQSRGTTPSWAGRASILPQQISFDQTSELEILDNEIAIRQDFDLRVAYRPLEGLRFAVREDTTQTPQVLIDENLTAVQPVGLLTQQELKQRLRQRASETSGAWLPIGGATSQDVVVDAGRPSQNAGASSPQSNKSETSEARLTSIDGQSSAAVDLERDSSGERATSADTSGQDLNLYADSDDQSAGKGASDRLLDTPDEDSAGQQPPQWREYVVTGGPRLIGSSKLSIITQTPWAMPQNGDADEPVASVVADVPFAQLLLPENSRAVRQRWSLTKTPRIETTLLTPAGSDGGSVESDSVGAANQLKVLARDQLGVRLRLRPRAISDAAPAEVIGSWLQTAITGNERRDRFVARVRSQSETLTVQLPPLAQIDKVAVDGVQRSQVEAPYDYNTNSLSVSLPSNSELQNHIIEVFYYLPETLAWITRSELVPPVIQGAEMRDRFYWQLVTPNVQHLAWCPSDLTAEWRWEWGGFWWNRQSGEDQTTLERWLGASNQTRLPLSANSYVMSSQGEVQPQPVWIVSRFVLWFPVGCFAILLSVLVISVPRLRHPITPMILAGVIISLAMIWPDLSVLLGQTAVISCSLVVLILLTQSAVDTRVRRRSVFTNRPSTYIDNSEQRSGGGGMLNVQPVSAKRSGSSVVATGENS